jgi:hypothetical protein
MTSKIYTVANLLKKIVSKKISTAKRKRLVKKWLLITLILSCPNDVINVYKE